MTSNTDKVFSDKFDPTGWDTALPMFMNIPEGIFRNNWTEFWSTMFAFNKIDGNTPDPCSEMQLNAVECLEAYGAQRGRRICRKWLSDFYECRNTDVQRARVTEMKKERIRQVLRGERKYSQLHDMTKPRCDGYQGGPFFR